MSFKSKAFRLVPGNKLVRNYRNYKILAEAYEKKNVKYEKKYQKVNHLYKHFRTQFGPGHFYSPYPDLKDIKRRADDIFDRSLQPIAGIDINEKGQLNLLNKLANYYQDLPYSSRKNKNLRYFFGLHAYSYTDATILFCMLRYLKPKRIIEIGSGYSSALMLDYKQLFDNKLELTFIEPYPQLLKSLIKKTDGYKLLDKPLHQTDLKVFSQLQAGDILFIDSTHVAKPGSDVNEIYFKILPLLNKGVVVHIHDIFYPFEYPIEWIRETRAWNEDYIVRAFLYKNPEYEITLFNHFLNLHHKAKLEKLMPQTAKNSGGSLWLKKIM